MSSVVQRMVHTTTCPHCRSTFDYAHQDIVLLTGFVFYDAAVVCPVCKYAQPHVEAEPQPQPDSGQPVEEPSPSADAPTDSEGADDAVGEVDQQRVDSDSGDGEEEAGDEPEHRPDAAAEA